MTAKIQSQTAIPPHKYSHLPIPTEAEMEEIISLIVENRNNSQLLKKIDEETPPHIMEALLNYSAKKTREVEQWAREVKIWRQEVETLTKEAKLLKKSIDKRLNLQTMN